MLIGSVLAFLRRGRTSGALTLRALGRTLPFWHTGQNSPCVGTLGGTPFVGTLGRTLLARFVSVCHAREKTGSSLCCSRVIQKRQNSSACCGGLHSQCTLSGSWSPGRTPPSVGARTPCPKAKARTGSNTRHGLPHSTGTPIISCSSEPLSCCRQGPSTSVLAQGHASGAGAPPTGPLLQGPGVNQMGSRAPC